MQDREAQLEEDIATLTRQRDEERAEKQKLLDGLSVLLDCLDAECWCADPPQDREEGDERGTDQDDASAHAQYCPWYLRAYMTALIEGSPVPG